MDSKIVTLLISIAVAIVLWLLGGFVFDKSLGMVCVFLGITVVGLAAGNVMDSPSPTTKK